jgi:ubiquinone/menaquinone biosynthesis C-methylase UbiE
VAADQPAYTIRGGRTDADRLARQARVMAAATAAFLSRVGVEEGWRCLDVGCGDGQVTLELARTVGRAGRAEGIDLDEDALAIARAAARQAGLGAEFVRADATEPPERDTFDLAYTRLLLSHLPDAVGALRAMRDAVRPGGWVAVEDLFTGTLRSEPPAPALDRLQEVYSATVRGHGGDPTIGPRLPVLLGVAGLDQVSEATVENPMTTVEDKLFLAELVDNMRDAMVASGAATAAELDELRADVERAARDPERVFHQARIHQVWGRRPG